MNKKLIDFPVDETLTWETAKKRGYEFQLNIRTVKIDPDVEKDFVELLEKEGYELGAAYRPLTDDERGLYNPVPLKKV
jgi:hypothetical protein